MRTIRFSARSTCEASASELYGWHLRGGALERLIPPWESVEIVERSGPIGPGARVVLRVGLGPVRRRWVAVHEGFVEGREFRDVQAEGPFASWEHTHRMEDTGAGRCVLEDRIAYALPFGLAGRWIGGAAARRSLARQFVFRHLRTAADLARHREAAGQPRLHVAISGAGGLVGSALTAFLLGGGHRVSRLTRGAAARGPDEIPWDPVAGTIDAARLEGLDAVVHLAGENIAGGRWSPERKRRIRDSRVHGTALVAGALARLRRPPRVLVSASAIGFYGDRGDEVLDETSPSGDGFLAETCRAWEAAVEPAERAGLRVVRVRTGVVLAAAGGLLARLLVPFRVGAGGRIGDGSQYMSWISHDDLVGVLHRALFDETLSGPINAVAPHPVTNAEFTRTLGRVLRRPTLLPLPAAGVRLVFGEMGRELMLSSTRVVPGALERSGFVFLHRKLEDALRFESGNTRQEQTPVALRFD